MSGHQSAISHQPKKKEDRQSKLWRLKRLSDYKHVESVLQALNRVREVVKS